MLRSFPVVMGLLLFSAATSFGQSRERAGGDLPHVGSALPDVKLYDDAGDEFTTKELRGSYSVLVFGCLT